MISYNNALVKALDDKIEVIERYEENGVTISSSHIRELVHSNGVDAVLKYIPKQAQTLFKKIVRSKIDG
jgi:citrate lyase synthetase